MKTMYGTTTLNLTTKSRTISVSSLNLSSAEDYFVILNFDTSGAEYSGEGWNGVPNMTAYVSSKSASSFTISIGQMTNFPRSRDTLNVSYQIVYNAN